MITIHNLLTNEMYYGDDIEFFVDEDTLIGEVYLDGDLIYQSIDDPIHDQEELELEFSRTHEVIYTQNQDTNNDTDYYDFMEQ